MSTPGASRSRVGPLLENEATSPDFVTAPTLTNPSTQAGNPTGAARSSSESFPDATTTGTPTSRNRRDARSQTRDGHTPRSSRDAPRLMLTAPMIPG